MLVDGTYRVMVGASSRDIRQQGEFTVSDAAQSNDSMPWGMPMASTINRLHHLQRVRPAGSRPRSHQLSH